MGEWEEGLSSAFFVCTPSSLPGRALQVLRVFDACAAGSGVARLCPANDRRHTRMRPTSHFNRGYLFRQGPARRSRARQGKADRQAEMLLGGGGGIVRPGPTNPLNRPFTRRSSRLKGGGGAMEAE